MNISSNLAGNKVVLILSLTNWIENVFLEKNKDYGQALAFCKEQCSIILETKAKVIITSAELSYWGPSMKEEDKRFIELHGAVNKFFGEKADRVTVLISGKAMAVMN
ncbi:MAG: bifunctional adenosylcobinamide kinase/adenosylcobinamide-phosphate guanylyltransferase [Crocinitomicaceae bacterium]|nr:bifunctional adenosylcobinamide kinase/adenosylcobinamide-phosphate guanylyltransferase [Crocinitomicaceae bacterium]